MLSEALEGVQLVEGSKRSPQSTRRRRAQEQGRALDLNRPGEEQGGYGQNRRID